MCVLVQMCISSPSANITYISDSVCLFVQEMTATATGRAQSKAQHRHSWQSPTANASLLSFFSMHFHSKNTCKERKTQKGFSHIFAFYCCLILKYSRVLGGKRRTREEKRSEEERVKN